MRRWAFGIVGAGLCLIAQPHAASRSVTAEAVPVVVELFTSEGCSSCPPADQLLSDLVRTQPVSGALIIGLGEHVDYWDHQGWRDPFSDKLFSVRQSAYAGVRSSQEVYTPQMIVDGTRVLVGQDRRAALDAIARSAAAPKVSVQPHVDGGRATVARHHRAARAGHDRIAGILAVIEDALSSSVTGGENSGRHLTHAAVVRQLLDVGRTAANGTFHKTVVLKLDPTWHRPAVHAIVFIQRRPLGAITAIGVTGLR